MSKKSLDALGVAITNAGYTWTPEMRSAYEKGIRESEWVGMTDDETDGLIHSATYMDETDLWHLVSLVEERLKEKNT